MTFLYLSDYSEAVIWLGRTGPFRLFGDIIIIIPRSVIRFWHYNLVPPLSLFRWLPLELKEIIV
jgi:hypothetical protein